MTKWARIIFISSLALNVILIIGFVFFKKSVSADIYRINALNAASDVAAAKYVLQEFESGDAERIRKLKQYLRDNIMLGTKEAEEYRQAAK
jgi:uncharacterized membrane protein